MSLHQDSNVEKYENLNGIINGKSFNLNATNYKGAVSTGGIAYYYKGKNTLIYLN